MRSLRTKSICAASIQNMSLYRRSMQIGTFPHQKTVTLQNGKNAILPLKTPIYYSKRALLNNNDKPFVEIIPEFESWLIADLALPIITGEADEKVPILDYTRDYKNPGPSGFRVHEKNGDFFHVQVNKVKNYPTWYQVDYYESHNSYCVYKASILCDVADPNYTLIDLVHTFPNLKYSPEDITNYFRAVLIYLRIWDYEISTRNLIITPFESDLSSNYKFPELTDT